MPLNKKKQRTRDRDDECLIKEKTLDNNNDQHFNKMIKRMMKAHLLEKTSKAQDAIIKAHNWMEKKKSQKKTIRVKEPKP